MNVIGMNFHHGAFCLPPIYLWASRKKERGYKRHRRQHDKWVRVVWIPWNVRMHPQLFDDTVYDEIVEADFAAIEARVMAYHMPQK